MARPYLVLSLNQSHVGMKYHIKSSALELTIRLFVKGKQVLSLGFHHPLVFIVLKTRLDSQLKQKNPKPET
jgi:hypothetical protein